MNDTRCVLHTLRNPGATTPAPFIFFGMSVCREHLVRAAVIIEEGSVRDVIRAARQGEI